MSHDAEIVADPVRGSDSSLGRCGTEEAAFLAGLPHPCFVLDREGRVTYANPRAAELFGPPPGDGVPPLVGRRIWDGHPELADGEFARECRDALAERRSGTMETCFPLNDGLFEAHLRPAGDRLCVFLHDVSGPVRRERELRLRAEELARASRGKDEFLTQLIHEVRNGLAPVVNALHLMAPGDPGDDARRAGAMAAREVERLGRLMGDLSTLFQPGPPPPVKEWVNFAAVVAEVVTGLINAGESGGRDLAVHLPPGPLWLEADPGRLRQVVRYLVDHAVRFTAADGTVRVAAGREGPALVLRVHDEGAGLAPAVGAQVFNPFARDRTPRGPGLGLALVRRLVQFMGGFVEAVGGGPGRGTEWVVRLPAPEAAPPVREPEFRIGGPGGRALRVLVVDDNVQVAQSMALLVGQWGCEVRVVYDGAAGLQAARAAWPDVVLLDIGLPDVDGYEVAAKLREERPGERLTLVALTGYGDGEARRRAREAGFDYHMTKPPDLKDLRNLLTYVGEEVPAASP